MREGICNVLPGIGSCFAAAIFAFVVVALASPDRPWYLIDVHNVRQQFDWSGRTELIRSSDVVFPLDPTPFSSATLVRRQSFDELGYTSLQSLYTRAMSLAAAAAACAAAAALVFLAAGLLRWLYDWESAPRSAASPDDALQITYACLASSPAMRLLAVRRRHGRALLVTELSALLLSLATAALLAAAVGLFAAEHRAAFAADMARTQTPCLNPGPCHAVVGSDQRPSDVWFLSGLGGSGSSHRWTLASGWSLAAATLLFCLGLLFVAVALFVVRNNRFAEQDHLVWHAVEERSHDHGYLLSEHDLLVTSSYWQGQEKELADQLTWSALVAKPFDAQPGVHIKENV